MAEHKTVSGRVATLVAISGLACLCAVVGGCGGRLAAWFRGSSSTDPADAQTQTTPVANDPQRPASGPALVSTTNPAANVDDQPTDLPGRLYAPLIPRSLPDEESTGQIRSSANIRQATFTFEGSNFDPTVSRDGKTVFFASTQHSESSDIYAKPVHSRVLTRLSDDPAQDVMPSISPDGNRIAFASDRHGSWDIFVMPATGGRAVQITDDPAHDLHPSWSPDGRFLVFCRRGLTSGRWELWVVAADNPSMSNFIGYGLFPEWCPVPNSGTNKSDIIAFQRSRDRGERTFAIWTLNYDPDARHAFQETQLVASPSAALINPSWSPDGRYVVYVSVPNPEAEGENGRPETSTLWMIAQDGQAQVPLTGGEAVDLMPTWGGNNEVFFVSTRGGRENIWSLDMAPAVAAAEGLVAPAVAASREAAARAAENLANVPLIGGN